MPPPSLPPPPNRIVVRPPVVVVVVVDDSVGGANFCWVVGGGGQTKIIISCTPFPIIVFLFIAHYIITNNVVIQNFKLTPTSVAAAAPCQPPKTNAICLER